MKGTNCYLFIELNMTNRQQINKILRNLSLDSIKVKFASCLQTHLLLLSSRLVSLLLDLCANFFTVFLPIIFLLLF